MTVAKQGTKKIKIPIGIACGKKLGHTIFISAGMHGNEINGIELLQRYLHSIKLKELTGTIIFLPILNVSGFRAEKRNVQEDNKDLNRSFNQSIKTVSGQIAKTIFNDVVRISDFGIDLHDSGKDNVLLPHTRVHPNKKNVCVGGCTEDLGKLFGTEIILSRKGKRGMISQEALKEFDIPVLTVETGGAMKIWDNFIKEGLNGLNNLLRYYNFFEGDHILPKRQYLLNFRKGYQAPIEGIITPKVKLGSFVDKGHKIAIIHNPITEEKAVIKAKRPGVVFSEKMESKVKKGEDIVSILHFKYSRGKKLPVGVKTIENKKQKNRILKPNIIELRVKKEIIKKHQA